MGNIYPPCDILVYPVVGEKFDSREHAGVVHIAHFEAGGRNWEPNIEIWILSKTKTQCDSIYSIFDKIISIVGTLGKWVIILKKFPIKFLIGIVNIEVESFEKIVGYGDIGGPSQIAHFIR